ncbi:MAG: GIY-YIG nuclease family protein [Patescibacteria group bacterium]|nr:GIY-YIG nuclease family protein [Patescibacteria group bacterium]
MLDKLSGVYCILNILTNKVYIGSAVNLRKRIYQHRNQLKYNKHSNRHLQRAYNFYGLDIFNFKIIEIVNDKSKLLLREQLWINYFQSYDFKFGYNLIPIAGSRLGVKHSEETKLKLRNRIYTDEIRQKMSIAKLGKPRSEETKLKISKSNKGRTISNEHKYRISLGLTGRKQSKEHLAKLSAVRKGKRHTEETKKLLSIKMKTIMASKHMAN